jgi:hypothetical protein
MTHNCPKCNKKDWNTTNKRTRCNNCDYTPKRWKRQEINEAVAESA